MNQIERTLPELFLRSTALQAGFADSEIRRLVKSDAWQPIRRGVYANSRPAALDPVQRHHLRCLATAPLLAEHAAISHVSAAVLHGIDLWAVGLQALHVSRDRASGGHKLSGFHDHPTRFLPGDLVEIDGMKVTTPARTVVDLARTLDFEQAVVVIDSALRRGLTTLEELAGQLAAARRRHGGPAARRAILFADGRSESVGESRSRVAFLRSALPMPDLQKEVRDADGRSLGRVDFWYEDFRVVGEFDGRVKYGRLLRAGQDPGDAVFAEKRREDALRDAGCEVVRWTWAELSHFEAVVRRIERARSRARTRRA